MSTTPTTVPASRRSDPPPVLTDIATSHADAATASPAHRSRRRGARHALVAGLQPEKDRREKPNTRSTADTAVAASAYTPSTTSPPTSNVPITRLSPRLWSIAIVTRWSTRTRALRASLRPPAVEVDRNFGCRHGLPWLAGRGGCRAGRHRTPACRPVTARRRAWRCRRTRLHHPTRFGLGQTHSPSGGNLPLSS